MVHLHPASQFIYPLPFGVSLHDGGVRFVVFSRSATAVRVLLYEHVDDREPSETISFDSDRDRTGETWSIFVPGLKAGQLYHFQADGPFEPEHGQRFDGSARLIDPYARALAGDFQPCDDGVIRPPKCVVVDDAFDWEGDRRIRRNTAESVIYEMHVRGFTQSPTSGVEHPGTYLGVIEKIPYLQSLGVTAVELMPIYEFPINSCWGDRESRPNYWGYDPLCFFAPHRGYASSPVPGAQVQEFKQMVRELHRAGIEVILDVVFNHTAEGNHLGPTLSFKGLENRVYYMLGNGGSWYRNFSGCGNTFNSNHPIVREMIFHCLRHWALNFHIDGFRFDLASVLSRDRQGEVIPNPPMVELIAEDPLLADVKIIAEAWDAAGAYQVGSFHNQRWAEWNGRYRDDIRRYWRGDPNMAGALATRIAGSSDLYEPSGRQPYHSINFITSHDGFPLSDLVSYNEKHNEANGEGNRDGDDNNYSYNYGIEGPTSKVEIERVRHRQVKNMLSTLMFSHGVPMLLMGDECRRTQLGNNNAYCQDNPLAWFDWRLVEQNEGIVRFCRELIGLRRRMPSVRRTWFLRGFAQHAGELPDVLWYDPDGRPRQWSREDQGLICVYGRTSAKRDDLMDREVMLLLNASDQPREFRYPRLPKQVRWRLLVDTAAASPSDIFPDFSGPAANASGKVKLVGRSLMIYAADM